ncbi:hypothetical protein [Malonomonas rubra]|uniref:hypothetical protein n=1 Tax=Malonomonas rubra TaxID=57040 RepID=UPI0026F12953|nr:hypothetical protein [Malonomonas rubra]
MRRFLKKIPYSFLVPAALLSGFAPFVPEPHLLEKIRFLLAGELVRFIDIFDLLLHSTLIVLLLLKLLLVGFKDRQSSIM